MPSSTDGSRSCIPTLWSKTTLDSFSIPHKVWITCHTQMSAHYAKKNQKKINRNSFEFAFLWYIGRWKNKKRKNKNKETESFHQSHFCVETCDVVLGVRVQHFILSPHDPVMRFTCLLVTERAGGGWGWGRERQGERCIWGWSGWEGRTLGGIRDWLNQDVISRNREERLWPATWNANPEMDRSFLINVLIKAQQ